MDRLHVTSWYICFNFSNKTSQNRPSFPAITPRTRNEFPHHLFPYHVRLRPGSCCTRVRVLKTFRDFPFQLRSSEPAPCLEGVRPCTLHPTPYTLKPSPYTLYPTPHTLTLNTLYPTPGRRTEPRRGGAKQTRGWPPCLPA